MSETGKETGSTRINCVGIEDEDYPDLLRKISDPPKKLYCAGDMRLLEKETVAVVGSRKVTEYGEQTAYKLGRILSEAGAAVVSGLARGVDSAAHRGALEGEGGAVGVMGCGIDICYPASNIRLWEKVRDTGRLISEYPPGTKAAKYMFPRRNRIISGLCRAVIVVEAGIHSGSLITAELAAEQGRAVYAVPGNIDRVSSFGSNKLIRDGATPLLLLTDVLEDLGMTGRKDAAGNEKYDQLGPDEKKIIDAVSRLGELSVDQICAETGMHPWTVNGIVTVLEMKGFLHVYMGRVFTEQ